MSTTLYDIGTTGKAVACRGLSGPAAKKIADYMATNGITTDAAKRAALNNAATLNALVKLFFDDAIQIVDLQTLTADS